MTKPVFVDRHVLEATADALTNLAASTASPEMLRQMGGGTMPVDEQLCTLEAAGRSKKLGDGPGLLDWDGSQDFSDWIEKVEARALSHLPLLDDKGELIRQGIHAFDEYQSLLRAGGMASLGVANPALQADWLCRGIAAVDGFHLSGRRTLFARGTSMPWLKAHAVRYVPKPQPFEETLDAVGDTTSDGFDAVEDSTLDPGEHAHTVAQRARDKEADEIAVVNAAARRHDPEYR